MSSATSQIHVTQPHALGVEEAVARLSKGDGKPSQLKLTSVVATFEAEIPGDNVTIGVTITDDEVRVQTGPLPWYVAPLAWLSNAWIKSWLEGRLK